MMKSLLLKAAGLNRVIINKKHCGTHLEDQACSLECLGPCWGRGGPDIKKMKIGQGQVQL